MLSVGWLMAEVVAGLLAEQLTERGQDRGACGARAVDERSAAGALEPGDLRVEAGLPGAEFLDRCEDAGVASDDHGPVHAALGAGSDEGAAERFGQVARVEPRAEASGM